MQHQITRYAVDVTYIDGSVCLYGPFDSNAPKGQRAIDMVERLKTAPNTMVVEARVRIINQH